MKETSLLHKLSGVVWACSKLHQAKLYKESGRGRPSSLVESTCFELKRLLYSPELEPWTSVSGTLAVSLAVQNLGLRDWTVFEHLQAVGPRPQSPASPDGR